MSSNFWSRSRSLKGLNHLVDDAFLRIDENDKKEGSLKTYEQEKEKQQDLPITSSNDEDAADEKDSIDEDDDDDEEDEDEDEDEKKNKSKVKEIAPYYDPYFFEDAYLKDTEYSDIIKTAAISGNQYRPNVDMLEKLLKMEDLTRILVLQLVGDHEDFLSLEDYFSNPLVLCKLLDYILDPRYCIEEDEEDEEENIKQDEEKGNGDGEKIQKSEIDNEKDTELTKLDSASSKKSMDLIEFYRCAVSAVDVLVIDINAIAESFLKHDFLIKKLWSMLDKYPCLANDASTAFLKINERLLQFAEMSSISEGNSMVSQWMDSMDNEEEEEDTFMDVFMSYPKKTENKSKNSEEEEEEEDEDEEQNNNKKDSSSKNNNEKNNNSNKKIGGLEETPETELMSKMSTLERYLYFIVMKENMVDKFIKHLEISSFMDFLLKIISTDKPKQPTYVILLLKQQRLIEKLLDCLDSSNVSTVQNTATDFLKALITLSANSNNEIASAIGPNELTRRLVSPGMISKIGLLMAQGGLPLSNCVGIIIEIIRKNHSDYDLVQVMQTTVESHPPDIRDPIYLGDMIQYFARNLPELCAMMKKSLPKNFKTPFGIIEPLGMDRFKVCELVAELLHCSNMALLNEPEGQLIVMERDPIRRVKVAELLKEHFLMESNDFDEEDEGQFDMRDTITIPENIDNNNNKTNGTSDKKENNSDTNNQLSNNEDNGDDDEDNLSLQVESLNIKSEENSSDDVLESVKPKMNNSEKIEKIISDIERNEGSNPSVETDAETGNKPTTTGEVFGDLDYLQTEEEIRKNPVIGDRLKLALKDNNVVDAVLEMLFDFPWNNFLHNVVFDIVQQILNGSLQDGINRFLIADLFLESRITELIIAGDQYCQQYEETNKLRLGYMGHLTLIAEEVAKFVSYLEEMNIHMLIPDIEEMLSEKAWVDYSNAVLNEARDRYNSTFGEEEAGMMGDCWGSNAFDNDGVIDFSSENELKHTSEGDDEVNDSEPVYPDVSFRNSVDEMMIGRHSDDIHIDLEAEDDDEEEEEDDDDEDRSDLDEEGSEEDGDNLNKKFSKTKRLEKEEEEEEDDVNEDSTIEYVNLNGEVVVTTVKEFLKMNSVASMNNPSSENDFKEIKNISNSKSEPNQVYVNEEEDEDDFDYINNSTLSKDLHHNGTMFGNNNEDGDEEDDDDDYIDPNDDGHSYAKINSLIYGNNNKLVAALTDENSSDSDEINSSNSDMSGSDVDDEEDEDDEERRGGGDYNNNGDKDNNSNNKKNNNITNDDYYPRSKKNSSSQKTKEEEEIDEGRALCRQKTKDNMKWDEGEQQRIFGYKMLHDESL